MKVSYYVKKIHEFGLFSGDGEIEVKPDFWQSYVKKRAEFEMLHYDLIGKLPKNEKTKLRRG